MRDITRQRIMEEEIRGYAMELEKASRLKDLYIDIIHHDLINPLGLIRNLAEFLMGEEDLAKVREYAGLLYKKVEDAIELVENAAMFQRIESGEGMEFKKADLKKYVYDAIDNLEALAKEKDITIDFKGEYIAAVNPLIGDVFSNLLSNAIKYSAPGTRVEVQMEGT
ncbi:MAG: HAMP domain-containing histidine kinase [Euryarchaeota archaeon]|nr:HAMP domain-containing histidine kinase [Euryarchaeota archaeon]